MPQQASHRGQVPKWILGMAGAIVYATVAGPELTSLEEVCARFPFSEQEREGEEPLVFEWVIEVEAELSALWPLMIDTSRLNRALGMPEMTIEERDGLLHGKARNGYRIHEWVEFPWNWNSPVYTVCTRVYSRGYGRRVRVVYFFEVPSEGTVKLHVRFWWIPRGIIGRIGLKLGMPRVESGYRRVVAALAQQLAAPTPAIYSAPAPSMAPESLAVLSSIRRRLLEYGVSAELVDLLIDYVQTADDLDAYRIQVRALALRWGVEEASLLDTCLLATREGLLQLSWDVICPHCRGVREEAQTLGDLPKLGACEVCDIDFTTDKENAIEVTFHVHPQLRQIPKLQFCTAEVSSRMHIMLQRKVAAGVTVEELVMLPVGRYRLRTRGDTNGRYLDVAADVVHDPLQWRPGDSGELASGPRLELQLINDTELEQLFVIESAQWADIALRPAHLFSNPGFRDLFSEEYLGADVQLDLGNQTILFTDMVGSTRFYQLQGDPGAFVEIRRHFTEVFAIVAVNRGAVVKTIGDAVMAAFASPLDAVRASSEIHAAFHQHREDSPVRLRISLNAGPCIAVNLNTSIDYFGGTVNVAAKLQACAEAGEIAMSPSVYEAPGVPEFLASQQARFEDFEFHPKSLDGVIPVRRWCTFKQSP